MGERRMLTTEEVIRREKLISAWVEYNPDATPEEFADFCEGLDNG